MNEEYIHEDELEISDESYNAMFPFSEVIDGVRMFPRQLYNRIEELEEEIKDKNRCIADMKKAVCPLKGQLKEARDKALYQHKFTEAKNRIAEFEKQIELLTPTPRPLCVKCENAESLPCHDLCVECLIAELEDTLLLANDTCVEKTRQLQAKIAELEKKNLDFYWQLQAAISFCQACGEMRTETEVGDGECYACGAKGLHQIELKDVESEVKK